MKILGVYIPNVGEKEREVPRLAFNGPNRGSDPLARNDNVKQKQRDEVEY
jgi:hypothetical protein